MVKLIQKFKALYEEAEAEESRAQAKQRISQEVYQLVDSVNQRYSQLNLDNGDFRGLTERKKLSKLIDMINEDNEISRLNSLSLIGSIRVEKQERGGGIHAGSGSGLNLCIGKEGLYIYDWDDFANKYDRIPATPDTLEKYLGGINVDELRGAVVVYTDRENYVKCVADFMKFM